MDDVVMMADNTKVNTEVSYGNTQRQLDRQNEVIDQIAKMVSVLDDRLSPILDQPRPRPGEPEEDACWLPKVPLTISSHADRLDEIFYKLVELNDRIDL